MFSALSYSESPLFAEVRRLEQEFDELFGSWTPWAGGIRSLPAGTFPAINVGSNPDSVVVYVFAPGIDPKSLDVSLQENVLSLSGQREIHRAELLPCVAIEAAEAGDIVAGAAQTQPRPWIGRRKANCRRGHGRIRARAGACFPKRTQLR